jgi:uncharacterized protein
LRVVRRDGVYVYVSLAAGEFPDAAAAIAETEGTTYIVERDDAERRGLRWTFAAAWLTVDAQTALDGVGVTATIATALADAGIPCNVLAAFHHDHLLVPVDQADAAIAVLDSLGDATS